MLFISLLAPPKPYDWTTDPKVLAWISLASLIVGVVSIVVGAVIGYWFYRKGRLLKQIAYRVISDTPIMSISGQTGTGKIKIVFVDSSGFIQDLKDIKLLTLRIQNTGNVDVKIWASEDKDIEDMEEPIEFEVGGRTVVSLTQVKTNPPDEVIQTKMLEAYLDKFSSGQTRLGLPRCFLKHNQWIELGILLQGSGSEVKKKGKLFNGEIVNFRDLEKQRVFTQAIVVTFAVFGLIGIVSGIVLLLGINIINLLPQLIVFLEIIGVVVTFIIIITILYQYHQFISTNKGDK